MIIVTERRPSSVRETRHAGVVGAGLLCNRVRGIRDENNQRQHGSWSQIIGTWKQGTEIDVNCSRCWDVLDLVHALQVAEHDGQVSA